MKNQDFASNRIYVRIKLQKAYSVGRYIKKTRTGICQNHNKPQNRMLVDICLVFCREEGTYSGLCQQIQDNVSLPVCSCGFVHSSSVKSEETK